MLSLQHTLTTNISTTLLKEFASTTLKAKRMSEGYLKALRIVLAHMSLADRLGVSLRLTIDVPFAGESTMRTLIDQWVKAGFTYDEYWQDSSGYKHRSRNYRGRLEMLPEDIDEESLSAQQTYIYLQRIQERIDATRHFYALGIHESDCPY